MIRNTEKWGTDCKVALLRLISEVWHRENDVWWLTEKLYLTNYMI